LKKLYLEKLYLYVKNEGFTSGD